jgi:hypothetical protein
MHAVIDKSAIQEAYTSVAVLRRTEDATDQEKLVNSFLDSILVLRSFVTERAIAMENLDEMLIKITHIAHEELGPEDFKSLEELVGEAKLLYSSSNRLYAVLRPGRDKGYIRAEAKRYKNAIDDFKETYQDIHNAFFVFPSDPEFQAITQKLEQLLG